MNQEIQPLFEVDVMKVALGSTPDPEVAALPKCRQSSRRTSAASCARPTPAEVPGEVALPALGGFTARAGRTGAARRGQRTGRALPSGVDLSRIWPKAEPRWIEALEREMIRLRQKLGRAEQIIEAEKTLRIAGLPTGEEPSR